jgi:hypothetical protein
MEVNSVHNVSRMREHSWGGGRKFGGEEALKKQLYRAERVALIAEASLPAAAHTKTE